jgi:hypothetical protein
VELVRYPRVGPLTYLFRVDTRRPDVAEPRLPPDPDSKWSDRVHPAESFADFSG